MFSPNLLIVEHAIRRVIVYRHTLYYRTITLYPIISFMSQTLSGTVGVAGLNWLCGDRIMGQGCP